MVVQGFRVPYNGHEKSGQEDGVLFFAMFWAVRPSVDLQYFMLS